MRSLLLRSPYLGAPSRRAAALFFDAVIELSARGAEGTASERGPRGILMDGFSRCCSACEDTEEKGGRC